MSNYLSIDTEATGLKEGHYMIQLAFIPVNIAEGKVHHELGREWLVKCPTFEELDPRLDSWNREHNKELIIKANKGGVLPEALPGIVSQYLEMPEMKAIFGGKRPVLLGKSMSALDIPMLKRYLGWDFYEKYFHHHTLDVTCVARSFVDAGVLPSGTESSSKLIKHFQLRDNVLHTALSDAIDMGEIYLRMLGLLKAQDDVKKA
jgi:hypothetical protein